jgi:hypothetical protein
MSGFFTINEIKKLDSVVGWDVVTSISSNGLVDKMIAASAVLTFASILLIIIKRIMGGKGVDLLAIGREMYVKLIVLATVFINPITYKFLAGIYSNVIKSLYEGFFKKGVAQVQWSVAFLAQKVNEATSLGLLDIINPVAWATNYLGCLISIAVNLAMIFYWLLASMVPIYVTFVILIIPPMMAFWPIFEEIGLKVLMLIISGIMLMFFVGLAMTLLGNELQYYAMSEMLEQGNVLILFILAMIVVIMIIAIPAIMMYLFDNGIFNAVQIVMSIASIITVVAIPAVLKFRIMQRMIKFPSKIR